MLLFTSQSTKLLTNYETSVAWLPSNQLLIWRSMGRLSQVDSLDTETFTFTPVTLPLSLYILTGRSRIVRKGQCFWYYFVCEVDFLSAIQYKVTVRRSLFSMFSTLVIPGNFPFKFERLLGVFFHYSLVAQVRWSRGVVAQKQGGLQYWIL